MTNSIVQEDNAPSHRSGLSTSHPGPRTGYEPNRGRAGLITSSVNSSNVTRLRKHCVSCKIQWLHFGNRLPGFCPTTRRRNAASNQCRVDYSWRIYSLLIYSLNLSFSYISKFALPFHSRLVLFTSLRPDRLHAACLSRIQLLRSVLPLVCWI